MVREWLYNAKRRDVLGYTIKITGSYCQRFSDLECWCHLMVTLCILKAKKSSQTGPKRALDFLLYSFRYDNSNNLNMTRTRNICTNTTTNTNTIQIQIQILSGQSAICIQCIAMRDHELEARLLTWSCSGSQTGTPSERYLLSFASICRTSKLEKKAYQFFQRWSRGFWK